MLKVRVDMTDEWKERAHWLSIAFHRMFSMLPKLFLTLKAMMWGTNSKEVNVRFVPKPII